METNQTTVTQRTATECRCAATDELLGLSPLHSTEDLGQVLRQARAAQPGWASLPVKQRVRYILKVRQYMVEHLDEISTAICRDNGKTMNDALVTEVLAAVVAANYYAKNAARFLKDRSLDTGNILTANKRSKIIRVPWGVIAIISPWNYPFGIPFSEVIMALMAGNTVILKTATQTQWVGLALKNCLDAAKLPPGVFSFVNLPGSKAGDLLLEGGVDKLFFTGSVPIGKYLMSKAAETLTTVSLELGGNDPMLVCEDADIYKAVMGALWGGFSNSGQSCGGVERIYVHHKIYEPFIKLLKEKIESLNVGYGMDFNSDIGTMTTAGQVSTVRSHIDDALARGAVIYAQSKVPTGSKWINFMPAMVLTEVNHEMAVMREESFGPVVGVMKVKDMEEAIALANDSDLGLSASVWSRNNRRAEQISRRIQCGVVNINDHLMSHGLPETPWGGFKNSSIGRTHGDIGFEEMTQPQVVIKDIMPFLRKNMWWHPYNESIYQGIRGIINFMYGKGIGNRIYGLGKFLKILPRMFSAS